MTAWRMARKAATMVLVATILAHLLNMLLWMNNDDPLVMWDGRTDFDRIALIPEVHPTPGNYKLLLKAAAGLPPLIVVALCHCGFLFF